VIYLVDGVGGAFAALAGGVAAHLGVAAKAATFGTPDVPAVVGEVLAEVGFPSAEVTAIGVIEPGSSVVWLGTQPVPQELGATTIWPVAFADGTAATYDDELPRDFERLTSIRRMRDALEQRIRATFAT
jgi:hypothetical protein